MDIVIKKSQNPNKKFDAIVNGTKKVSFGAKGYQDYTMHHDPERKDIYIKRHSNENWSKSNVASPAWLSRFILWEKPSLKSAIVNANKKYSNIHFQLK